MIRFHTQFQDAKKLERKNNDVQNEKWKKRERERGTIVSRENQCTSVLLIWNNQETGNRGAPFELKLCYSSHLLTNIRQFLVTLGNIRQFPQNQWSEPLCPSDNQVSNSNRESEHQVALTVVLGKKPPSSKPSLF